MYPSNGTHVHHKKRRSFFVVAFNAVSQLNDKFQCNNNDNFKYEITIFFLFSEFHYNDVESQSHALNGIIIHRRIAIEI